MRFHIADAAGFDRGSLSAPISSPAASITTRVAGNVNQPPRCTPEAPRLHAANGACCTPVQGVTSAGTAASSPLRFSLAELLCKRNLRLVLAASETCAARLPSACPRCIRQNRLRHARMKLKSGPRPRDRAYRRFSTILAEKSIPCALFLKMTAHCPQPSGKPFEYRAHLVCAVHIHIASEYAWAMRSGSETLLPALRHISSRLPSSQNA